MSYALVVDDNDLNTAYVSTLLRAHAFEVECAANGALALSIARRTPPVVVVSDLLMPILDGFKLLQIWKSDPKLKHIPFIVYTATYSDPRDERLARDLGADAYIRRPNEPDEFMQRLRQVLEQGSVAVPAIEHPTARDDARTLSQYNEALIRRLDSRSRQLKTTQQELEAQIYEKERMIARQIAILDALSALVAMLDSAGNVVAVNEAWRKAAADNAMQAPAFGVGMNYLLVCDAGDATSVSEGIRAVLQNKSPAFSFEYECNTPTGPRWYLLTATPLHAGELDGAVVMHLELTDRKLAEIDRRESREQYLLLLNSTAEGIFGLDLRGVCTFSNAAAARALGYQNADDMVGIDFHGKHHYLDAEGNPSKKEDCVVLLATRTGSGSLAGTDAFCRLDGTQIPVDFWSYPIRRDGTTVGLVVTFLDATERRNLEARLLQAQKMEAVGRLAGGMAHDFNNTLQVVLTSVELLGERTSHDPTARSLLSQISVTGQRAASFTRQLLTFSRRQLMHPIVIDLNETIRGMEGMLRPLLGEDIALKLQLEGNTQPILADNGQIQQVLMNLIVNARDALPQGGRIDVRTSNAELAHKAQPYVVLSISDSGSGMDQDTQRKIFDPFFTTKDAGTGLGLASVYGIVTQWGGHIEVRSELGQGSTFDLYIPLSTRSIEAARQPVQIPRTLKGSEAILLVEDEHALRQLLAEGLRSYGYTVLEAGNGQSGISLADTSTTRIDLLLTDVILPDISGQQVADHIIGLRPSLKRVFMSGYAADYVSARGGAKSEVTMLEKPFTLGTLLQVVRETLDH
jgi:PAS domain S-box-containing protein